MGIADGEVLEDQIPGRERKKALAWIEKHKDELKATWDEFSK